MPDRSEPALDGYYHYIMRAGKLPTLDHARRWSTAVLNVLGTTIGRSAKRRLARDLPRELSEDLSGVFWLLHFRDPHLSEAKFRKQVALRGGNSDPEFSRNTTLAVFGGLKTILPAESESKLADALPPAVAELWEMANGRHEPPA
jgi:uncharacterized protein (DUF2267 family)